MKVSKAIELLTLDLSDPGSVAYEDREKAQELSIEALKRHQNRFILPFSGMAQVLPGEVREHE